MPSALGLEHLQVAQVLQRVWDGREPRKKNLQLATLSAQRRWATVELQTLRRPAAVERLRPASRDQLERQLLPLLATQDQSWPKRWFPKGPMLLLAA